jgi:hypothetical protein
MLRVSFVRRFCCFLVVAFVGALGLSGCGEDMSQPKTIESKEAPKDLAKESQQYFTKEFLQKKGTSKKG